MLSTVEAWWGGLCALPFDGAQGDSPSFVILLISFQFFEIIDHQ
ncbi:hypothetical protein SAMN05421821_102373 [Mucilaginibacter lappiensis]|uniref:Uncharacterized protein n=1 Tax=Mucilaginibacter lappiensis TaxID=354630 RepID=A0A1N6SEW5_9SPHI|nr:hypothetical protein [Mucilaginibacter lappiensis]MBB6130004.1 hypothetical protein [Mucilaginibacter lappiensis]SIQ39703.1 hypothetical protein SAMN05421821_102373 [Mucilaginibacter lappiensis]